jgi:hypothetical protein
MRHLWNYSVESCDFTKKKTPCLRLKANSPLFEVARLLVRLDHVARFIVNANHSIM